MDRAWLEALEGESQLRSAAETGTWEPSSALHAALGF